MEKPKRQDIEEELRNIAPGLSGLPHKRRPEDIPFRYFEKLSDRVIRKMESEKAMQKGSQPMWIQWLIHIWYGRRVLVVSMASALAVILIAGLWMMSPKPVPAMDFSQINPLEARSYLLSCAGDLDDGQLSLLNDQNLDGDFMPVSEEELEGVIEDYLYQLPSDNQLN